MIGLGIGALRIFVALEPQDMRKSFQGLSELAMEHLDEKLSREAFPTVSVFTFVTPLIQSSHGCSVSSVP